MKKKLQCIDFCGCGLTCKNTNFDPVLENNNFSDDDDEKVNDAL